MRTNAWLLIALIAAPLAAACGGDEDAPPPPPPPPAPGGPAPAAPGRPAAPAGPKLSPRVQIEQKIICAEVEKATGPACSPDGSMCDPGLYCLPVGQAFHCEPCPERDTIRHDFKDRDFVADQVRDPFQSFVIVQPELVEKTDKKIEGPCNRPEQFIAPNYSYMDLQLVGIVSQGAQRKVLMMDRGNLGHIIRLRDCVGKEKAVVKDIGTGYVTFVVQQDAENRTPNQGPGEYSVLLHPKTLDVGAQPQMDSQGPRAPIVAPPGGGAPPPPSGRAPAPAPAPAPASGAQKAPAPAPAPPPTAPTVVSP